MENRPLSAGALKLIAILAMLIDHIAFAFSRRLDPALYWVMRGIGRIAFVIFCFFIVEGFFKTRNVWKYLLRLGIFAIISEIPYDLFGSGKVWDLSRQNVFFTLALGLAAVALYDRFKAGKGAGLGIVFVAVLALGANFLNTDYGAYGVLTIFVLYAFKDFVAAKYIAVTVMMLLLGFDGRSFPQALLQTAGVAGLGLTELYNGRRGMNLKYIFYAFYPVHLLALWAIKAYGLV